MLPQGIKAAPDNILKRTHCSYESYGCKTPSCSSSKGKITCSEFCKCMEDNMCLNEWTRRAIQNDAVDEDEDDDDNDDN